MQDNFISLTKFDSSIIISPRYHSNDNFIGRKIKGYDAPKIVLTFHAAKALAEANKEFNKKGFNLVVYDGYRPMRAVQEFVEWTNDHNDQKLKDLYYPNVNKAEILNLGYLSPKSSHSRGSTVDLTLISLNKDLHEIQISSRILPNGQKIPFLDDGTIDMGSSFDLFEGVSHHNNILVSPEANQRRELLKSVMLKYGFDSYEKEWWHYTLINEPFPDVYFDFVIK